tara:strand:+ start:4409 stop:5275 length:867 start_codon:yes stop_codon:yes gene_type:complete
MKGFLFPGQGSQFIGMGKDLFESNQKAKSLFNIANEILGFKITDIMFKGSIEDLKQTDITQPSIFLHSVILFKISNINDISAVAGHSLGEFSALTAIGTLSFEDGLKLVIKRARAMQKACELSNSTMAAVLGMTDEIVERICENYEDVVPANYNSPGQLVISGSISSIDKISSELSNEGAKVIILPVGGGFHSSYMDPAKKELEVAINNTKFLYPNYSIYQNYDANSELSVEKIKEKLILQLTSPVKWTQTVQNMISDGILEFYECGPGRVLQGLVKKINREVTTSSI